MVIDALLFALNFLSRNVASNSVYYVNIKVIFDVLQHIRQREICRVAIAIVVAAVIYRLVEQLAEVVFFYVLADHNSGGLIE